MSNRRVEHVLSVWRSTGCGMVIAVGGLLGGCLPDSDTVSIRVQVGDPVEHVLRVRNETPHKLEIVPSVGERTDALVLERRGSETATVLIPFLVTVVADGELAQQGWYRIKKNAKREYELQPMIDGDNPVGYIDMIADSAVVRLRFPDGVVWDFALDIGDCWETAVPEQPAELSVSGEPFEGMSQGNLCRGN